MNVFVAIALWTVGCLVVIGGFHLIWFQVTERKFKAQRRAEYEAWLQTLPLKHRILFEKAAAKEN